VKAARSLPAAMFFRSWELSPLSWNMPIIGASFHSSNPLPFKNQFFMHQGKYVFQTWYNKKIACLSKNSK
jgi:hypothetical protein